ncbi:glycosyltransferase family 4 protein [Pedobacter puniceum]|uniref:Glycosyltransferase n=1 Tax=Pedobacter puniceum TaxID=2666136 RepID=A0A7K0FSP7_9SPHI|nr:glycosyltransferase family 1 protein [Pedobacter puniceum]MRX48661.1 glycosyltransferase [Pedobacter puniceum]
MKTNKINIFYDTCIFEIQNIGGISIVFGELINRIKNINHIKVSFIGSNNLFNNLIFPNIKDGIPFIKELKLPKAILPFTPLLIKLPKWSIYHSTYNRYSFQKNITKIITIHDLGYEKHIMQSGIRRIVHLFFKKIAIKNANAIICVSKNTFNDLKNHYGDLLTNKIVRVIYNGVDPIFFTSQENSIPKSKNLLFVGGRHPYKNFKNVVLATKELKDINLIIAGGGNLSKGDISFLEKHIPGRYSFKKNLSTAEMASLYKTSLCLVYPSSYEGFGLPLLEAMAAGCPVVACKNSCIEEIAGDAAVLIKDSQVINIIEGVQRLSNESFNQELITKGKLQAKNFTWEKTVYETLELYKSIEIK